MYRVFKRIKRVLFCLIALAVLALLLNGIVAKADGGGAPFDPGDGRVNPFAGDRIAVWCNPTYIDIWGLDFILKGFRLSIINPKDVMAAGTRGITKKLGELGTLKISVDKTLRNYTVIWIGGIYVASGTGPFSKTFTCNYAS